MHLATISFASGVLFLLGFYVIPVFAEKIPHGEISQEQSSKANSEISALKLTASENDEDGDGLPDYWEKQIGSEVLLADTDGDGVSDGLEVNLKKK